MELWYRLQYQQQIDLMINVEQNLRGLCSKYKIIKQLGEGGFAKVYLAEYKNQKVALKCLNKVKLIHMQKNEAHKALKQKYLISEVQIMKKCQSQFIVQLKGQQQNQQWLVLVLEYCENGSVLDMIYKQGSIKQSKAIKILQHIITGYATIIQNKIIHRDLKTQNILIKNDTYKISDFGLSKQLQMRIGKVVTSVGSSCTIAPQVAKGLQYDIKADIWSLGVIFYEMLTGTLPFQSLNITQGMIQKSFDRLHQMNICQKSCNLIKRLFVIDPNERMSWQALMKMMRSCSGIFENYNLKQSPSCEISKPKQSDEKQKVQNKIPSFKKGKVIEMSNEHFFDNQDNKQKSKNKSFYSQKNNNPSYKQQQKKNILYYKQQQLNISRGFQKSSIKSNKKQMDFSKKSLQLNKQFQHKSQYPHKQSQIQRIIAQQQNSKYIKLVQDYQRIIQLNQSILQFIKNNINEYCTKYTQIHFEIPLYYFYLTVCQLIIKISYRNKQYIYQDIPDKQLYRVTDGDQIIININKIIKEVKLNKKTTFAFLNKYKQNYDKRYNNNKNMNKNYNYSGQEFYHINYSQSSVKPDQKLKKLIKGIYNELQNDNNQNVKFQKLYLFSEFGIEEYTKIVRSAWRQVKYSTQDQRIKTFIGCISNYMDNNYIQTFLSSMEINK